MAVAVLYNHMCIYIYSSDLKVLVGDLFKSGHCRHIYAFLMVFAKG